MSARSHISHWKAEKKAGHLNFDVESWYPKFAEHTFWTKFVPFSVADAKAFIAYYQQRYNHRNELSDAQVALIRAVEGRVEAALREVPSHRAFVRMSSRSPKDGQPLHPAGRDSVEEERARLVASGFGGSPENATMRSIFRAQARTLRVESAREAMNIMLTSERVFTDLLLAVDCTSAEDDVWSTCIILRDWDDKVRDDYEFRAFVCGGRLTALSQYNHYCLLPHIILDKDAIAGKIEAYWREVHALVGLDEYVIDFALLGDATNERLDVEGARVVIIELNPYMTTTGGSMFDWSADAAVLHGEAPFEFRLRTEEIETNLGDFVKMLEDQFDEQLEESPYDEILMQIELPPTLPQPTEQAPTERTGCLIL